MLNILQLISLGGYYDMREAGAVASFQHMMDPGFGGNLASVLKILLIQESGRD